MQTLNINLPQGVQLSEQDILTAVATRLYDTGKLNLAQAAGLAGYDMSDFIQELTAQTLVESSAKVYQY